MNASPKNPLWFKNPRYLQPDIFPLEKQTCSGFHERKMAPFLKYLKHFWYTVSVMSWNYVTRRVSANSYQSPFVLLTCINNHLEGQVSCRTHNTGQKHRAVRHENNDLMVFIQSSNIKMPLSFTACFMLGWFYISPLINQLKSPKRTAFLLLPLSPPSSCAEHTHDWGWQAKARQGLCLI